MSKDEIQLALRLVAMGRVNHPQVEDLAEKLAGVFSADSLLDRVVDAQEEAVMEHEFHGPKNGVGAFLAKPEATKRRKKAD